MSDANIELFETVAKVLLYCWIFGFLLLLAWFGNCLGSRLPLQFR